MEETSALFTLNNEQAQQIEKINNEKEQIKVASNEAKQNFKDGLITEEEYVSLKAKFTGERKKMEKQLRLMLMSDEEKEKAKQKNRETATNSRKRKQNEVVALKRIATTI